MPIRSHIQVQRSNGQTFANMATAYRALAGSATELPDAETRRIRAALRTGRQNVRDSRGFTWASIGRVELTDVSARTPVSAAIAEIFPRVEWNQLTFGVELEVTFGSEYRADRNAMEVARTAVSNLGFAGWKVVPDASVSNGCEVVSPILQGENGMKQVQKVCDAIKATGLNANQSCGFHVHIGAREFSVTQLANVCRAFKANEAHFDSIVAPSRRNNRYAQNHYSSTIPVRAGSVAAIAREFNGGYDDRNHYTSYRYRKLNLQSYACHGTLEFRQHQGTVEAERALGWIRLVTGFFAAAVSGDFAATDFAQFAAKAGDRAAFIVNRKNHFAARLAVAA